MRSDLQNKKLVVGVNVADTLADGQFIQYAISLAKRAGLGLHLVHVHRPYLEMQAADNPLGDTYTMAISQEIDLHSRNDEELLLEKLAKSIKDVEVSHKMLVGTVEPCLIDEAQRLTSPAILVSTVHGTGGMLERGFSTALSLMSQSPIPVLVVNRMWNSLIPSESELRLVIADDFSANGYSVIEEAVQWAGLFSKTKLLHLHIHSGFLNSVKEISKNTWLEIKKKLAIQTDDSQEEWFEKEWLRREHLLKSRYEESVKNIPHRNIEYESKLLAGDVQGQLSRITSEFKADMIFFGRHAALHFKPFGLGGIPCHFMLSAQVPVLLCPKAG